MNNKQKQFILLTTAMFAVIVLIFNIHAYVASSVVPVARVRSLTLTGSAIQTSTSHLSTGTTRTYPNRASCGSSWYPG